MLMYAYDQPMTLTRISSFWLPELRRLEVNVLVILVGCKLDLRDKHDSMSMEQVPDAFYYARSKGNSSSNIAFV
ncbi:hypothetical protein ABKV19_008637 [Rosa sericea]